MFNIPKSFFILTVGMLTVWKGQQASSAVWVSAVGVNPINLPSAVAITLPRGIRNNNAGNLELTRTRWQGQVPASEQTDERFMQFVEARYGIRAIARLLKNYQSLYGLYTVNDIINRYAPSFENNTSAYANAVAKKLNIGVNDFVDVRNVMHEFVKAIITHENGYNPYSDNTIDDGVRLA